MKVCTHLFNFFTSPAESQIFPLIQGSPLFILLCHTLWQLIASRAQLHLQETTRVCVWLSVVFVGLFQVGHRNLFA